MTKGQVALEFLTSYGWIMLTVLVAISGITYFGFLSPEGYDPENCWFGGQLVCEDYLLDENETLLVQLRNDFNAPITIINVTLSRVGTSEAYDAATCSALTLEVGESAFLNCVIAQEVYERDEEHFNVRIGYREEGSPLKYTTRGSMKLEILSLSDTSSLTCGGYGGQICTPPHDNPYNCAGEILTLEYDPGGICCLGTCVENACEDAPPVANDSNGLKNKCCKAKDPNFEVKGTKYPDRIGEPEGSFYFETSCEQVYGPKGVCADNCVDNTCANGNYFCTCPFTEGQHYCCTEFCGGGGFP